MERSSGLNRRPKPSDLTQPSRRDSVRTVSSGSLVVQGFSPAKGHLMNRSVRLAGAVFAAALLTTGASAVVDAHFKLVEPASWLVATLATLAVAPSRLVAQGPPTPVAVRSSNHVSIEVKDVV